MLFDKQATNDLTLAIAQAERALGMASRSTTLVAMSSLLEAWAASLHPGHEAQVRELLGQLRAHAEALVGGAPAKREQLERTLAPCVQCESSDLLVSRPALFQSITIGMQHVTSPFTIIVCADCGDTRFRCDAPGALERLRSSVGEAAFNRLRARGARRGPFR